ncbi:KedN5 family methylcobalamin-dependent radical SAM C-methyltransferase [Amycolatopsis japonica]|uniref:KedN5 family methylcobalamin-dependent radical SAM C-methyltransferase n=1 Tax=Amycolatopsis japonica TaxID=208439 RepID=UPI003672828C
MIIAALTKGDIVRRHQVVLVQQGVWAMPLESMPLAAGYLKAAVDADVRLNGSVQCEIVNLRGGQSVGAANSLIFGAGTPDVLAISVFGWNFRAALVLAETFKQINPRGLVVLGGTHVARQADRTFRLSEHVDVIVNSEGEQVFPELLHAWFTGTFLDGNGGGVTGISYRDIESKATRTNPDRPRIQDLSSIASPFLTGAVPLVDHTGKFRYDVAILETNRGCPYHCAFCYWGGAVGQKVRRFPRERVAEEVEIFAHHKVDTLVLCDANFGMQPADEDFVDDVIRIKKRTGYPRAIETSWAKNKSATFYRIVRKMRAAGLHSSFTVALQTLDEAALDLMNRRNMKVNEWETLVDRLSAEGLECYAELLWGVPGVTVDSFFGDYDRLARKVPRIAVYPLILLPNTDYKERKEQLGIITTRGQDDDFEYVLATDSMSLRENLAMQGFLLWARAAAENSLFRYFWAPARELAGLSQSTVLKSLAAWFGRCADPAADPLRPPSAMVEPMTVHAAVRALFLSRRTRQLLQDWFDQSIRPGLTPRTAELLDEVLKFDLETLPLPREWLSDEETRGLAAGSFVTRPYTAAFDVPAFVEAVRTGRPETDPGDRPTEFRLRWRIGIEDNIDSHEVALQHMASAVAGPRPESERLPRQQTREPAGDGSRGVLEQL